MIALRDAITVAGLALVLTGFTPPESKELEEIVPFNVMVSVGPEALFAAVRVQIEPSQLGLASWSNWDEDGDGKLVRKEQEQAAIAVRDRVVPSLRVVLAGRLVPLDSAPVQVLGPKEQLLGVRDRLRLNIATKSRGGLKFLGISASKGLSFLVYAVPLQPDGIVPLRLSLPKNMRLIEATGTRAELQSPQRLEAVTSRATPALWGRFQLSSDGR